MIRRSLKSFSRAAILLATDPSVIMAVAALAIWHGTAPAIRLACWIFDQLKL